MLLQDNAVPFHCKLLLCAGHLICLYNIYSTQCFQFDWEGDLPVQHAQKDLIIYEMHVRGFTRHESSQSEFPGTYLGLVEKLDYLKVLF